MKPGELVVIDLLQGNIIGRFIRQMSDGSIVVENPLKITLNPETYKLYMYRYSFYSEEKEFIFNFHSIISTCRPSQEIMEIYEKNVSSLIKKLNLTMADEEESVEEFNNFKSAKKAKKMYN